MNNRFHPKRILVTGASGGLGGALAQHYAGPGVQLLLWGRDEVRLAAVAKACEAAGASALVRSLDLVNIGSAVEALSAECESGPIDLAILAAGSGDIRASGDKVEGHALVARLGQVNFVAPAAMAAALAERMADRGTGSIVLIGSAAGFHALPFAAAYSGTKAGIACFAEALRLSVRKHGVNVTLISPGFIDTAAARKVPGPKPLIVQPQEAARRIAQGVAAGKAHVVFPWPFALLRLVDRLLPGRLRNRILLGLTPRDRQLGSA